MRAFRVALILVLAAGASSAWSAPAKNAPHIGYVFPAGGRQGSTVEVLVGGQLLKRADAVHVSGEGVRARIVQHYGPVRVIYQDQRKELVRQLIEAKRKRLAELPERIRVPAYPGERRLGAAKTPQDGDTPDDERAEPVELPAHPLLRDISNKNLHELQHIVNVFLDWNTYRRKQQNAQIDEMVLIEVAVDADAAPGCRELRLQSEVGMTNSMPFYVGTLPEVREQEPNDPDGRFAYLPGSEPLSPPIMLNGRIMPGDVDRFQLALKGGQRLVIETHARRLVPFLADAVPGWFQAVLALYDDEGNELAFADDYRFRPDPVLLYEVPENGVYKLEVRDAVYRGREDFVYRISVGEQPFITHMFPLGGREGVPAVASVAGWNLPATQIKLDTTPGGAIRRTALRGRDAASNEMLYAVDTLPEVTEAEPNNDINTAQAVNLPQTVNGRIGYAGDVDVYRFVGRAGSEVVAEVIGRRLYSPIDSVLRLTNSQGDVIEWNDDHMERDESFLHRDMDLLTHHADSYLKTRLPGDGIYYVHIVDAQSHGGGAYAYRLRISPPRPGFELRMTPATINIGRGRCVPITVYALRKDGFQGGIDVVLKDAPLGFALTGGRIPPGQDEACMTLTAPRQVSDEQIALHLEGWAQVNGKPISRTVVPCEDVMQAFLYRHLIPSRELLATVSKGSSGVLVAPVTPSPVRIPVNGSAQALFRLSWVDQNRKVELEVREPARGVIVRDAVFVADGLAFTLNVEADIAKVGYEDNVLFEVFSYYPIKKKDAKDDGTPPQMRRVSLGYLPAVPFVVVEP